MTAESSMFGTFDSFEQVTTDTYTAIKLSYTNRKGELKSTLIFDKVFKENPTLGATLKSLTKGQHIDMSGPKNGKGFIIVTQVKAIVSLPELKTFGTFGGKTGFKDNTVGQIKGNVVSNAVTLAISRNDTSKSGLLTAATDVLELHRQLEAMDIGTIVGLGKDASVKATMPSSALPSSNTGSDAKVNLDDIMGALTNKASLI